MAAMPLIPQLLCRVASVVPELVAAAVNPVDPHPLVQLVLRYQLLGDQVRVVVRVRCQQLLDGPTKVRVVLKDPDVLRLRATCFFWQTF